MQQHFDIYPSVVQLRLTLTGYTLIALGIIAYVEPLSMMLGGLLVIGLLALREVARLLQNDEVCLTVNPHDDSFELKQDGQPYFFNKYKVYAARWFAILRLIDKRNSRTLILIPDRFNSIQSYRRLRYALQTMGTADAA